MLFRSELALPAWTEAADRAVSLLGLFGLVLLLWREAASVRAFKAYCSHQGMELMASGVKGRRVTCAQHGWQFDMPDGRCGRGDKWSLTELAVSLVNGRVRVQWRD